MAAGSIGWIHFDERDRSQVDELLEAFRKPGMLDELGFGRVRDSFADLLAPGLSTIHTRIRYMLFVPWIFRELEEEGLSGRAFRRELKVREVQLIDALARGPESNGIIGIQSREKLSRFPSSIYWNGLLTWRIRRFSGTLRQYARTASLLEAIDDEESFSNWHPGLPLPPRGFLKKGESLSFELQRDEANYLLDRIRENSDIFCDSLIGELARPENLRVFDDDEDLWSLHDDIEIREPLRTTLFYARVFSMLTHGANLLYNLQVIEQRRQQLQTETNVAGEESLHESFEQWHAFLNAHRDEFQAADWGTLRKIVDRASSHTVRWEQITPFLEDWRKLSLSVTSAAQLKYQASRLIEEREQRVKGARARLGNPEALQNWKGISGTNRLTYRWPQIRSYMSDLARGVTR